MKQLNLHTLAHRCVSLGFDMCGVGVCCAGSCTGGVPNIMFACMGVFVLSGLCGRADGSIYESSQDELQER